MALLLLAVAVPLLQWRLGDELQRRASSRVETVAAVFADQMGRVMARRHAELSLLEDSLALAQIDSNPAGARAALEALAATSPSWAWIGVVDLEGRVLVATHGLLEGVSIRERPVFTQSRDKPWVGDEHPPVALAKPMQAAGRPVPASLADLGIPWRDAQGRPRGVLAAHLDVSYFESMRQRVLGPEDDRRELSLLLLGGANQLMLGDGADPRQLDLGALDGRRAAVPLRWGDETERLTVLQAVPAVDSPLSTGWRVVAAQPMAAVLAPVNLLQRDLVVGGGLLALLLGGLGAAWSHRMARDLTDRRAAEKRLREEQETLAGIINSASDAVVSTDEHGRITLFNPAAERIFGRLAADMVGQPLDALLPAGQQGRHRDDIARFAHSASTRRAMGAGRVRGLRSDGAQLELEASISQVTVAGRKVLTAILRDVTERVQAEARLQQYRAELSALTQQLLAQEKETTKRLAQTLHDQLGQTLAALRLSFDAMQAALPPLDAAGQQRLASIAEMLGVAVREVREVLTQLRPPLLDQYGLVAALDHELRTRGKHTTDTDLLLHPSDPVREQRWPADVEYAAFMVAREAVANALRHSQAALVTVAVDGDAQRLKIEVADDGRGFAPELAAGRPGHLGMVGMRERAAAIGARFDLQTQPGEGSTVVLEWAARA